MRHAHRHGPTKERMGDQQNHCGQQTLELWPVSTPPSRHRAGSDALSSALLTCRPAPSPHARHTAAPAAPRQVLQRSWGCLPLRSRTPARPAPKQGRALERAERPSFSRGGLDRVNFRLDRARPSFDRARPDLDRPNSRSDQPNLRSYHAHPELDQATSRSDQANFESNRARPELDQANFELNRTNFTLD